MGTSAPPTASSDQDVTTANDLRVVIIDQRHDRRLLMRQVVQLAGANVNVVGFAEDPASAVETVARLDASVAVVEIQLPVAVGLETITALRDGFPQLRIIVCSFFVDIATRAAALTAGADGYLVKPVSPRDIYPMMTAPAPTEAADGPVPQVASAASKN